MSSRRTFPSRRSWARALENGLKRLVRKNSTMPVSELDLVRGGLRDFRLDNLRISRHALDRAKERHIPLEDLRRTHGEVGRGVQVGNTIVTALRHDMTGGLPPRTPATRVEAMKADIRTKLEEIGLCKRLTSTPHYDFFRRLLQHHPTPAVKRVSEIVDISIVRQSVRPRDKRRALTYKDMMLVVHYPDGTRDSISWTKCVPSFIRSS